MEAAQLGHTEGDLNYCEYLGISGNIYELVKPKAAKTRQHTHVYV